MKKLIALFMAVLMIATLTTATFAAQVPEDTVHPNWNYMSTITLLLNFDDDTGFIDAVITPYNNITTRIDSTVTVYRMVGIDWVYVGSTSDSETDGSGLAFGMEFPAVSGVMYKAVLDVTSYGESGSETESVKKIRTCP